MWLFLAEVERYWFMIGSKMLQKTRHTRAVLPCIDAALNQTWKVQAVFFKLNCSWQFPFKHEASAWKGNTSCWSLKTWRQIRLKIRAWYGSIYNIFNILIFLSCCRQKSNCRGYQVIVKYISVIYNAIILKIFYIFNLL